MSKSINLSNRKYTIEIWAMALLSDQRITPEEYRGVLKMIDSPDESVLVLAQTLLEERISATTKSK